MNGSFSGEDRRLLAFVQQQIKTGTRTIQWSAWLLEGPAEEGLAGPAIGKTVWLCF